MSLYTNSAALALCGERAEFDLYPTPWPLVEATVRRIATDYYVWPGGVLDIGCADGRWLTETRKLWPFMPTTGIDIRPREEAQPAQSVDTFIHGDYLALPAPATPYSLIIGNIPYRYAERLMRKAWDELAENGLIVQLLLLNFLGSQRRMNGFFKEIPLHRVYVLGKRPSFRPNKSGRAGTDAREYAVFVWRKGETRNAPEIQWLYW